MKTEKKRRDELISLVQTTFSELKSEYGFNLVDLNDIFSATEAMVPASLFQLRGSPLSLIVTYLIENLHFTLSEVSKKTKRSYKACWAAYKKGAKKSLHPKQTSVHIPLDCFLPNFSIMESIVFYLKENQNFSFHSIAKLLGRDDRTIWTHCNRARKKRDAK